MKPNRTNITAVDLDLGCIAPRSQKPTQARVKGPIAGTQTEGIQAMLLHQDAQLLVGQKDTNLPLLPIGCFHSYVVRLRCGIADGQFVGQPQQIPQALIWEFA
jgi:hypothetical protein